MHTDGSNKRVVFEAGSINYTGTDNTTTVYTLYDMGHTLADPRSLSPIPPNHPCVHVWNRSRVEPLDLEQLRNDIQPVCTRDVSHHVPGIMHTIDIESRTPLSHR